MRVTDIKPDKGFDAKLVEYTSLSDLGNAVSKAHARGMSDNAGAWGGGSSTDFFKSLKRGNLSYASRAAKYVKHFSNVAIREHGITFDYNMHHGVLDYHTALTGDPMCMYGATIAETDRSPVHVYVDPWVSGDVGPHIIERRGIAVLALVQALSIYRPVKCSVLKGSTNVPSRNQVIQIIDIPTAPMDLARASWMLSSPMLNRQGFLVAVHTAVDNFKPCVSPPLYNVGWQQNGGMAKWMAERDGVDDVIFLHRLTSAFAWDSDDKAIAWVKDQLDKYVPS